MAGLSIYDLPFEGTETAIIGWVEEALELRHGEAGDPDGRIELPAFETGRDGVLATLRRVRVRLDRLEELQAKSRQAKGRVSRVKANAEFEAQVEYDRAMQQRGNTRVREYVTADEKRADAALDTIAQKRVVHQTNRLQSIADEAYDVVKGCYWGMDKIRTELLEMLKVHESLWAVETHTT